MNGINKLILSLIILSIAIAGIGLASAADIDDFYVTDSDFNDESLDVDNTDSDLPLCEIGFIPDDNSTDDSSSDAESSESFVGSVDEDDEGDSSVDDEVNEDDNTNDDTINESSSGSQDEGKNNNSTDLPGPKIPPVLNISGPKVQSDLNISGPKIGDPSAPGTFDDLQVEINNAESGSILHLFRDYKGHYGSRIQFNKDLTINGHGHTLDCANEKGCSAFYSSCGNIILKNLKIINGHNDNTDKGGAIYITGSAQYTLINCKLLDNWADDYGGAIYNGVDKPLTIINCTLMGNTADDNDGGAIWSKGVVNIENSTLESNKANVDGGAVYCERNVNVLNSLLHFNRASGATFSKCYGGAICSEGDVYIDNSTVNNNQAFDYGGAVYAENIFVNTKVPNSRSLFCDNMALDNDGGALYAKKNVTIYNSTFSGNRAYEDGGAVFCNGGYVKFCEFGHNKAIGSLYHCYGGGIRAIDTLYLYGSYLHDNMADFGGAVATCWLILPYDPFDSLYNKLDGNSVSFTGSCPDYYREHD